MQNWFINSFNGCLLDVLLNGSLSSTLDQARVALAIWRADYKNARPPIKIWLADANRAHQDVPASGDGAAQPHQLRAVTRRYSGPAGQIKLSEQT